MIVVCINNEFGSLSEPLWYRACWSNDSLLLNKQYKVLRSDFDSYLISDEGWFYRWRFVTLESYRDKQIDYII
jgi:hypothetical protein